ncbi:MAG: hypothetical protein IT363_07065 [Methanoregulaceae archaeon]|nr:hypothetical protein [Methanoregulaceae archaeon]
MKQVFGRTNIEVPERWLRLIAGADTSGLAAAALATGLPLDVSSQPALWGGHLRREPAFESTLVMARSSTDFERASDESNVVHLVHAHLIEVLSSLGRQQLDFYFVRVRQRLQEYQINGVLQALEMAREDGLVRFQGLAAEASALVVRSVWQGHDGFEAILVGDESAPELQPIANERRVGVLHEGTSGEPRLISVRTVADVEAVVGPARV